MPIEALVEQVSSIRLFGYSKPGGWASFQMSHNWPGARLLVSSKQLQTTLQGGSISSIATSDKANVLTFDVETTGLNKDVDQIIELACKKGLDAAGDLMVWRFKPSVSISLVAERTHGIRMDDLAHEPSFASRADEILEVLQWADVFLGYNVRFDIEFLEAEFGRAGRKVDLKKDKTVIDPYKIWQSSEPRRLEHAYGRFVGAEIENAHSAGGDVEATLEVYHAMLEAFSLSDASLDEVARMCNPDSENWIGPSHHLQWSDGQAVIEFGKYKGRTVLSVVDMDSGYLKWVLGKDFPKHVHNIIKGALSKLAPDEFHDRIARHFPPPTAAVQRQSPGVDI